MISALVRAQLADWLPAEAGEVEAAEIDAALDRIVVRIVREDALRDLTALVSARSCLPTPLSDTTCGAMAPSQASVD